MTKFLSFRVLQIPAFPIPGFRDSGFSHSGFCKFRVLQIPALMIPGFTDSGFSHFGFSHSSIPFPDSPFLVLQIADCYVEIAFPRTAFDEIAKTYD